MKKIQLLLKATLFCLAAVLSMGIAQAGPFGPWTNDAAPFGTNGNVLNNWSLEQPNGTKIATGYDTLTYWFSHQTAVDSGFEGGLAPNATEAAYDGVWGGYTLETDNIHCMQTSSYKIQATDCFLVSVAAKALFCHTAGWALTDGYWQVVLYYGGTTNVVTGVINTTLGTEGTPFFTNVIHVAGGSDGNHNNPGDYTNYFFGVNASQVPALAHGQFIGIDIHQVTTNFNSSADPTKDWLSFDGVVVLPTNAIPPITTAATITPTNSVYGGDALSLNEIGAFGSSLGYQWQTDGGTGGTMTNIPSATTSTWGITAPTGAGTYDYQVIISNTLGTATSAPVALTVRGLIKPTLTQDVGTSDFGVESNVVAYLNGTVRLFASFDGAPTVTNQWLFSTTAGGAYSSIGGGTSNLLIIPGISSGSVGYYKYTATNGIGSSNSAVLHLTTLADPAAPTVANAGAASYCLYTNKGLVAYWKFEETQDTFLQSLQAYDYSGHNLNATYGNSIPGDTVQATGCYDGYENYANNGLYGPNSAAHYTGFVSGNYAAFMNSPAVNGTLTAPPLNLNTNTVTITMWIYPFPVSSGTGTNAAFSAVGASTGLLNNRNGADGAGVGYSSYLNTNFNGASLGYTWNSNSASTYNWNSGLYPLSQKWSMVTYVITPSNTTIYLYYVGVAPFTSTIKTNLLKAVNNVTNGPQAFSGGTTWLGGDNNNARAFPGAIDEVAVYTNAWTEAQVQDAYLKALGISSIAPVINVQPVDLALFQGQSMSNYVNASALPSPTYQWQFAQGLASLNLWTNVVDSGIAIVGSQTPTLVISNWPPSAAWQNRSNFHVVVVNSAGSVTSRTANVSYNPLANYNGGSWVVNFAMSTTNGGSGNVFSGRGILGTGTYWNKLNTYNNNVVYNLTSLRDDGSTSSGGVTFNSQAGIYVGNNSSTWYSTTTNNLLLDTYAIIGTNTTPLVFANIPNGKYNLALYGCVGGWTNRAIQFTVLTNGVSAGSIGLTNVQDVTFSPDNTALFKNLIVQNQKLEVDVHWLPCPAQNNVTTNGECEFNGAQLQLLQGGPTPGSITPSGGNLVFTWSGGGMQVSTNVQGPWTTNGGVSPFTFAPTGSVKFFRIVNTTNY